MKKLKWIVIGLFAVVVALVVAVFVVLSTMDFERLRGTIETEARKATGRDLTIAGPIDLKISLTPAVTLEQVTFANADWGSRPEMVTFDRLEVVVEVVPLLSGEIDIKRLILVKPDILLETNAQGRGNWALEQFAEAAEEAAEAPQTGDEPAGIGGLPIVHEVVIEDGRVTYKDGQSGQEIRLALTKLDLRAEGPGSPMEVAFDGAYNDQAIKLSGTLAPLSKLADGPYPFDLKVEAGGAAITAKGEIAQPMAGQGIDVKVSAKGESLADLSGLAGTDLPPLGPYDVSTRVALEEQAIALTELTAKVGGSDLSGQARLKLGGERPAVSGAFVSQQLDIADFAAGGGGGGEAAPAATGPYVFTEDPLPLEGLRAADADIKLTAASLRLEDPLNFENLDVTLSLANGHLKISPLTTVFSKGRIEAIVDLDGSAATPTLSLGMKGAGVDYGQLLKDMQIDESIQGTVDLDIDLRGTGGSMRAIASGLNGRTEIVAGQGVISNRLLKIVGVGLGNILGPLFGEEKDATLNCIVSRFDIQNGLATSQAMIFDSEVFTVTGGGTIDLKPEKLDLKMDTSTREVSVASLAVPFLIRGTLKKPSFTPDPTGTALKAAKTVGMFIVPPVAIGNLIAEQTISGSGNACLEALEAAAEGGTESKSTLETVTEQPAKVLEGVTGGIKSLFGSGD